MDLSIAALLAQDGITNGAIYALLALALVMVFAVTRVILVPSGELLTIGALTLAAFDQGHVPGTVRLVAGAAVLAGVIEAVRRARRGEWRRALAGAALWAGIPLALAALAAWMGPRKLPLAAEVAMALALTGALGPLTWKIVFEPIADASVLVLLIVAVAVHFVLTGLALYFFGAEGSRTPPFSSASFDIGALRVSVQSLLVLATSALAIAALALFFGRTLYGKALHATSVNRLGARLCGISPDFAGALSFALAAVLCAFCGVLIGPITTLYYDSGFIISLKGFVGAIIGGLASYPLAAAGSLFVGLIEAFSSFWASAYKEVIVFTLIIPVLLWRSLVTHHHEEDE
ncbi:MAG TPA: branched-chain amino acid ABC transporter permease [Casimicrobiaceae bacterium]|nr:branched-chain amino acid ABC transporter permease [Casimicrobiaceae bacterium]